MCSRRRLPYAFIIPWMERNNNKRVNDFFQPWVEGWPGTLLLLFASICNETANAGIAKVKKRTPNNDVISRQAAAQDI